MADYSVAQNNLYNTFGYGYNNPSFKSALITQKSNNVTSQTQQTDTVSISTKNQVQAEPNKKGLSKSAKWGFGTSAILGLGALAYVLTRCKTKPKIADEAMNKLNNLVADGNMDKQYLDIFIETYGKEGKSFIKEVYNRLVKTMGYNKHKPKLNIVNIYKSSSAGSNRITISLKAFPTKEEQVDAIRHELEHFRQHELVYRSFGREAYINARIEPSITILKLSDEKCIEKFGKTFKELSTSELEAYKTKVRTEVESKLQILEDLLKEKGGIPSTSAEYAEAEKYLQAMKEYVTPTAIWGHEPGVFTRLATEVPEQYKLAQDLLKKYANLANEQGAIREGTKIKDMYKLFIETIA